MMHGLVVLETNMHSKSVEEKTSVHMHVSSKGRGHDCLHSTRDDVKKGKKSYLYLIEIKKMIDQHC